MYASAFRGSFWWKGMPSRSSRARLSRPIFCSMSDSDIGKTLPFAHASTAGLPAASTASSTAGSSFDAGVGRNWLSITIATFVADASSSEKRGPETGDSSAARAASVAFADRLGLVRVDRREQVRVRDVELERLARDLALVVRRSDRQRVERLVRDRELRHRSPPVSSERLEADS